MKRIIGLAAIAALALSLGIAALSAEAAALIGEARAKEIALKHAGVAQQQARFTKVRLERDNGRMEYELEFYAGGTEYDYEINAETGDVIKFSREVKNHGAPQGGQPGLIGEAKAKSIALARVPGAKESDIRKFKLDRDDGRQVYEGEIFHNMREYEFEIDAKSGEVLKWEIDD
ncbi:MAG: PepSY domain-containing protein [Synergistaceae bacterium]|nr:PepSY domain-containing protein [Synergistaceae bacterium]